MRAVRYPFGVWHPLDAAEPLVTVILPSPGRPPRTSDAGTPAAATDSSATETPASTAPSPTNDSTPSD
jgi:hypothetical protein